jgi:hypothetical protein
MQHATELDSVVASFASETFPATKFASTWTSQRGKRCDGNGAAIWLPDLASTWASQRGKRCDGNGATIWLLASGIRRNPRLHASGLMQTAQRALACDILYVGCLIRVDRSALRQVWLKEKAPGFDGLIRGQNKRREFLWVHPQYEQDY